MNKKELVTIEFRYHDISLNENFSGSTNKTITIGIFDTLEEAINKGNEAIEILAKSFEVRHDDKFMLKFLFGAPKRLVSNCCYSTRGIQYFARITPLYFDDLSDMINETFMTTDRYIKYKKECETD